MSFFTDEYRKALSICGSISGKNIDKVKEAGLSPITSVNGGVTFTEARMFFDCNILSYMDIDPANFRNPAIDKNYPLKDYHRMYVCEIVKYYTKQP